jgi:hypothetical protein
MHVTRSLERHCRAIRLKIIELALEIIEQNVAIEMELSPMDEKSNWEYFSMRRLSLGQAS